MQPGSDQSLDTIFAALADPTRRAILSRLAKGEATVSELAAPFSMSQPAISKHLRVLERAGLISRGREAQRRPRRLEPHLLADATLWLEGYRGFWEPAAQAEVAPPEPEPEKKKKKKKKKDKGKRR